MAIEAARARVPLSVGARLSGLNHVAELRARYGSDSGKELARFMAELRDKRDPCFEENIRALAAIFSGEIAGSPPRVRYQRADDRGETGADYRHEPFSCCREFIS